MGLSADSPLTCTNGSSVDLLQGSRCLGSSTSNITALTAANSSSSLSVPCPSQAGQVVQYLLVADPNSPAVLTDPTTCASQTRPVFVRNTDCQPPVSLACSKGTTAVDPLLCNGISLNVTDALVGANCTLTGGRYVSNMTVPCPLASPNVVVNITLQAEAEPNHGGLGCARQEVTLYLRSTGQWGERRWTVGRRWRASCSLGHWSPLLLSQVQGLPL